MREDRTQTIALILLAVALVVGAFVVLNTRPTPVEIALIPPAPTATPAPSATPAPITVYITGAVDNPQITLTLSAGSRVSDAISAAGGLLDDADLDRVNMAALLRDGDQVHVFAVHERDEQAQTTIATPSAPQVIFINQADAEALTALPGIGPALAERIIARRDSIGRFNTYDDLLAVSGIGEATIERLRGLIDFD
ncbi:MAG: ComEA family DNA-binding protein [Anaerolineaceae bacterium]|nr:MAG: ComEA family DNA-binding protein [Anaerolineaceae bacterium]